MDAPLITRKLIVQHHQNGHSCRSIAAMVNIPKTNVIRFVRHFTDTGSIIAKRIGRCGRPRILSERDERALARVSVVNPKKTAQEIRTSVGSSASISTVKRALRRQGRLAFRPRKSPSLNAAQQRTRLKWCLQFQHWDEEKWRNVSQKEFNTRNLIFLTVSSLSLLCLGHLFRRDIHRCHWGSVIIR
jgi:transposase